MSISVRRPPSPPPRCLPVQEEPILQQTIWEKRCRKPLDPLDSIPAQDALTPVQRTNPVESSDLKKGIIQGPLRELQLTVAEQPTCLRLLQRVNQNWRWYNRVVDCIVQEHLAPLITSEYRVYALVEKEGLPFAYFKPFEHQRKGKLSNLLSGTSEESGSGGLSQAGILFEWLAHRILYELIGVNANTLSVPCPSAMLTLVAATPLDPLQERCVVKLGFLVEAFQEAISFDKLSCEQRRSIPLEALQAVVYVHCLTLNRDVNGSNLLVQLQKGRVVAMYPIDHEYLLSPCGKIGGSYCWLQTQELDDLLAQPWGIRFPKTFSQYRLEKIIKNWITDVGKEGRPQEIPSVAAFLKNAEMVMANCSDVFSVTNTLVEEGCLWGLTPLDLGILSQETKAPPFTTREGSSNAIHLILEAIGCNMTPNRLAGIVQNFVLSFKLFKQAVVGSPRQKAEGAWNELQKHWLRDFSKKLLESKESFA